MGLREVAQALRLRLRRAIQGRTRLYAWDRAGVIAIVESLLAPLLQRAAQSVFESPPEFSAYDELRADLEAYCLERARIYGESVWQAIVRLFYDATLQGWDETTILQQLDTLLQGYTGARLEAVYRTELMRFENWASVYEMARMPEVVAYRYSVTLDDRTSDICKGFANKVVRKSDLIYIPPLHYNCRTVLVPLLADDDLPLTPVSELPRVPDHFLPPAGLLAKLKGV